MGMKSLFKAFKKKKDDNNKTPGQMQESQDSLKILKSNTQKDHLEYIKENCELVAESENRIKETKVEYQAVTSYLTDMQRIDLIPADQREALEETASHIIALTRERLLYQQKDVSITDRQYRLFERYEIQIPKDMPAIRESEVYQGKIEKDMEHLEKEKKDLSGQEEEIVSKQAFLRGMMIVISIVVLLLFLLFTFLGKHSEADFTLPFLLTVMMGMASALYNFLETRKNHYEMLQVQIKQKRAVTLMNKVKIKSVNNRSYLEYIYEKYGVENYEQLKHIWEEYLMLKEESKKYQSNTRELEFYNKELIKELQRNEVADCEIWIYQPNAIVDSREMVEIRHRLNGRRQKLRETIDMAMKQKEEANTNIENAVAARPEYRQEADIFMKKYQKEG